MKIEHEIPNIAVIRHRTIAQAFAAGLGKHSPGKVSFVRSALRLGNPVEEDEKMTLVLHEPLWVEHEGAPTYRRTCALASLEQEMGVHEFHSALDEKGYYPASLSEGLSYLPCIAGRDAKLTVVIHLSTCLLGRNTEELRLLTKGDGKIELIPFFPATKLKSYYHVVVVRDEKKIH